jgi:aryl-alcohol dehydrogenase
MAGFIPFVTFPMVYGHEGVGIVEEVGLAVDSLKVGDRVALTYPSCGVCPYCVDGHPYACDSINELFFSGNQKDGTSRLSKDGERLGAFFAQGAFATHVVVDARNAVKVTGLSDDEAKYLCSMGCGAQTGAGMVFNRIKPEAATSLAVFGAGGVGQAAVMAASIAGCKQVIAVDANDDRLALARDNGATDLINVTKVDDVAAEVKKITGGGAHYAVESSGIPDVSVTAMGSLRRLGLMVLCSVTGPVEITFAPELYLMNPSATFAGLTEGGSNPQVFIPKLIEYYKQGRFPIDKLVKFYKFEDIKQAFEDSHSGKTIKPILLFD